MNAIEMQNNLSSLFIFPGTDFLLQQLLIMAPS